MTRFFRPATMMLAMLLCSAPAMAVEKRYGLTSFDKIVVEADYIVEVVTRAPISATASGSQDALDRVSIEARDGTLVIGSRQFAGDQDRNASRGPVTIRVNAMGLREAVVVGSGSLTVDRMKGAGVSLGLRGPGWLDVAELNADRLNIAMIGNGTMTLGGAAKKATVTVSGAGAIDAGALKVSDLTSDSEGTGDHIFNAVKTAAVTARGLGKTVVLGKPVCTVRNVGSGTVQCGVVK